MALVNHLIAYSYYPLFSKITPILLLVTAQFGLI